jgi:hypothetical protein
VGLLLAGLLLGVSAPAEEASAPELVWYQLEVVLFERTDPDTAETFATGARPEWPRDALALGPIWPEPVRPRDVGELLALWQDLDATPRLRQVPPGLSPETGDLIRWLRDLEGTGSDPGSPWLPEPEDGAWQQAAGTPDRGTPEEGASDPGRADGDPPPEPAAGAAPSANEPQDVPLESLALDSVELEVVEPPEPEEIPIPLALAFRDVAPEHRLLQGEVRRLERAAGYRVLAHRAWRQPFRAEAPALPVRIRSDDPQTGEIELAGSIGVTLRRYLHARLELYRRVPATQEARSPLERALGGLGADEPVREPGAFGIEPDGNRFPLIESIAPEAGDGWFRIVHERRMRSGETHYLDHPRIAVLIRIEPFLLAEPLIGDGAVVRAVQD